MTQPQTKIVKRVHHLTPRIVKAVQQNVKVTDAMKTRLDLLNKIYSGTKSVEEQMPVIAVINEMTRFALNASASSILLFDENHSGSSEKFTDCPLGTQFQRFVTLKNAGVAALVAQKAEPIILNDIDKEERYHAYRDEVTGIVARSIICAPMIIGNSIIGVLTAVNKLDGNNFVDNDLAILAGLAGSAASTIQNVKLNERLLCSYKNTVQKLVSLADSRETTESRHSRRVAEYSLIGAKELNLSNEEQQEIEYGAILHDIGLLSIPQSITNKKTALTKEDWAMIRKHPVIGYNLLRGIPTLNQVGKLILYHHERYDGKGYPCGLKGDTIPIGARLLSVADAFDSMTIAHSYRAASSPEAALKELGKCAGTQFCPDAVKAFSLGYIRSRSLGKVRHAPNIADLENFIKPRTDTPWPISFNQGSLLGKTALPDTTPHFNPTPHATQHIDASHPDG